MCVIWLDRHVHKNGGTSIRNVMTRLMQADALQQAGGWSAMTADWVAFVDGVSHLREPCSAALRGVRVGVEAHEGMGEFTTAWLDLPFRRAAPDLPFRRAARLFG